MKKKTLKLKKKLLTHLKEKLGQIQKNIIFHCHIGGQKMA